MTHVLVVDREQALRMALRTALELHGHRVIEAADGSEAYRAVLVHAPELIVTDVTLPDAEGHELVARLRLASSPARLIALFSRRDGAQEPSGSRSWLRSVDRLLEMPFTMADLLSAIDELAPA